MAMPLKHRLDRRAAALIEAGGEGDDDDLLSTRAVAHWLGVSTQWIEIGRSRGYRGRSDPSRACGPSGGPVV
jgi:hypothetical protein